MIADISKIISDSYTGYFDYVVSQITQLSWSSYFYWLVGISLFFWLWEIIHPWRKNQAMFRKDFWLDLFYMFFNFFLFNLIIFVALANTFDYLVKTGFQEKGISFYQIIDVGNLPVWAQLASLFIVRDITQYTIHRILHAVPFLWQFHKIHHSVSEMGFAAHLRYHWMETVVYRTLEYIPLSMLGFSIENFILVHLIALSIGHFNHSNVSLPLGPLKYIFNNPKMHIWHHAKTLPAKTGVNFGISLSLWDYLFRTNYIPSDGRDITIGYDGMQEIPKGFIRQFAFPVVKQRK